LDRLAGAVAETPPAARKRVAVSGLSIFCADVANYARSIVPEWHVDLLRTNSRFEILTSMFKLCGCDVWYSIGNPATDRWLAVAAKILRKPRVIHWVGSDILILGEQPHFRKVLSTRTMMHLAEATWTAQELQQYGLKSRIVPLPPRHHHGSTLPLPAQFTVMLYLPRTRAEFYGRSAFEQLMRNLRGKPVRYVIVGGGELDVPAGVEAKNLGWRNDLREAYKDVSVLVRFTAHDGLSLMVLEALSYGRHVVWTQPFPYVRQVRDYAGMERAILDLLEGHEGGALQPQDDASQAIRQHYAPEVCVSALAQAWDDASRSATAPVPVGQLP
jgi:glycosyltransferase involved in cell wall biosynthesis